MIFNFSQIYAFPPDIVIGESEIIKEVTHTKLLGLVLQSNLKWNKNTEYIYGKAATKLWLLRRLRKFDLDTDTLTDFYVKEIRSILEYAVPAWYSAVTIDQSKTL